MLMADQDTLTPKKFFFDEHIFDEDHEEEIEEETPPPPTFSEEELEAAKKDSYDKGFARASEEAEQSREKFIAEQLEKISKDTATLFSAEQEREKRYESEALRLAMAIFERLFPALNEEKGLDEIRKFIEQVFAANDCPPKIKIIVRPDDVDDIQAHTDKLAAHLKPGQITVAGDETLGAGDCRLLWDNGGAERSANRLAGQIGAYLEEMLAEKPALHDNKDKDENGNGDHSTGKDTDAGLNEVDGDDDDNG